MVILRDNRLGASAVRSLARYASVFRFLANPGACSCMSR